MLSGIADCCKTLKLSRNIVENCSKVKADTNEEFLFKILKLEVEHRKNARNSQLIKKAGFQTLKSFVGYEYKDIKFPPNFDESEIQSGQFISEKQNIIMYGNVGTGKTHLATAIGFEACKAGKNVGFFRTAALVNQLTEYKKNGKLSMFLKKLNSLDLLICDEWGYVPLEREGCQMLFQVISDAYEKRSVIITTNIEFSKWINVFYDEQMTAAMIDRLIHHSYLLVFDGPSYRMKNATMKISK
jgi:DNA replication protein DnaC